MRRSTEPLAAKVPEITVMFWILKILTTGMGEAMSDFMGQHSVPVAGAVGVLGTAFAFRLQYRRREYHAPTYWLTVMMVAIFGTMVADGIKDGLGLSYAVTTPVFAALVALVFWRWRRSEGTLDIHTITTRRRETFYWAAVLATFALGTAAGDLTAITLDWGFFPSLLLFGGIIALPLVGWWRFGLNPVLSFWAAYVVTRPLGASFADWFSKPHADTGLGLGDGTVSAIELVVFIALVAHTAWRKDDIQGAGGGSLRRMARPRPEADRPAVPPALHELEAEVMDAVWDAEAITVRGLADQLNAVAERPRAYTTYLTICQRLDGKGLLTRERAAKAHVYRAAVSREGYADARAGAEVAALVEQFGDEALVHFARAFEKLDPAKRQKLRRIARR